MISSAIWVGQRAFAQLWWQLSLWVGSRHWRLTGYWTLDQRAGGGLRQGRFGVVSEQQHPNGMAYTGLKAWRDDRKPVSFNNISSLG
jgi:hypothetical protein